jgi:hypothetical protein
LNLLRAYMEKTSKGDIASIVVDGPHVEGRAADLERFREDPNIHCVVSALSVCPCQILTVSVR